MRVWPYVVRGERMGPQERLEQVLGRDFARRLVAALVGHQAPYVSSR